MLPDPQIDPLAAQLADPWGWVPPEWNQPAPPVELAPAAAPAPLTEASLAPPLDAPAPAMPPPEVAPDAITGAAPPPGVADLHGFNIGMAQPPTAADEVLADPFAMRDNGPLAPSPAYSQDQINAAVDQIALKGGPQLEQMAVDREMARRAKQAADTARIETDNLRQAQDHADAFKAAAAHAQEKSDQIVADAMNLSKVEPDRLVNRMTGGQTVAQLIALAMGGLIAGRTGGPNVAMDLLQRRIDRDIDAQKADIESAKYGIGIRRSAVADEYARHGDLFRAGETVRLAAYQSALNVMAAEQQNFDPRGFQAIERGRVMQRWASSIAQSAEATRKTAFDETLKTIKADQEEREQQRKADETASTIAKNKAETAKLYADASATKADKQVWAPAQLGVLNPGLPTPPIPMSQADYTKWLGTQRTGEEAKTAARLNDPHELAIQRSVPGVTDDKGDLVQFADKDIAAKVADAKEGADEMHRLTAELIGMIKRNGWTSDFVKSKEWRNARQNYNEILIRKKEQDKLGVLTGPDVGIVTQEIGTEDPTEARGEQVLAALEHFDRNQIEGFNTKIRNKAIVGAGRKVGRWEPPPIDTAPAQERPEQAHLQALQEKPEGAPEERLAQDFVYAVRKATVGMSPDDLRAFGPHVTEESPHIYNAARSRTDALQHEGELLSDPQRAILESVKARFDPTVTLAQQDEVAALGSAASGNDEAAAAARQTLSTLAEKAQASKLRALAKSALESAGRAGIDTETPTMGVR